MTTEDGSGAMILGKLLLKNCDRLPLPEYRPDYQAWIASLVERYDGDGKDDMPGVSPGLRSTR